MRTNKIIYVVVLLLGSICVARGQENIKSTVTVTKEFQGRLMDVQKSKFNTSYSDTLLKFKLNFDYSTFDRPYHDLYEFSPIDGIQLQTKGEVQYPVFYMRGMVGYPLMPEADLYVQPRLGERHSLLFYGNHHSMWGNKGYEDPVDRSVTRGGLSYAYNWKKGEARANGYYRHNYHKFKETEFVKYGPNVAQSIGGDLRVRSLNPNPSAFYYDFKFEGVATNLRDHMKEFYLDTSLDLGFNLAETHRMFVRLGFENSVYNNISAGSAGDLLGGKGGLFRIEPHYAYTKGRIDFLAGIGFAGVYGDPYRKGEKSCANIYPRIFFTYEAVKGALWLNASIEGDNTLMSGIKYLDINPWYRPLNIENYAVPIKGEIALKGAVKDIFGYSLAGRYLRHDKYYSFYSLYGRQVCDVAEDVNEFNVEARINLKTKAVKFEAGGLYRNFMGSDLYMTPNWKADALLEYNYMERIYAQVGCKYLSRMEGRGVSYKGFVDLSAKLGYVINTKFSLFLQGKNLLNNQVFYLQDYIEPGVNFALGLFIKL